MALRLNKIAKLRSIFEYITANLVIIYLFIITIISLVPVRSPINMVELEDKVIKALARYWVLVLLAIISLSMSNIAKNVLRYYFSQPFFKKHNRSIIALDFIFILTWLTLLVHKIPIPEHPKRLLYVIAVLSIIALLSYLFSDHDNPEKSNRGILQEDIELRSRKDLNKSQELILDDILRLVLKEPYIRSVGLYGSWGSGKSSIIKIAKQELLEKSKDYIWIEFDPWPYTSQESLLLDFYKMIGKSIDREISGIQKSTEVLVSLALRLIAKEDSSGMLNMFSQQLGTLNPKNSSPEAYIERTLLREKKTLIIVLDNTERLYDPLQIYRTLQLVHSLKKLEQGKVLFYFRKRQDAQLRTCTL